MIPVFPKHRPQNLVMFTGLAVALFYVAVYRPLSYRADALDQPLAAAFAKLTTNSLAGFAVDASTPTNVLESLARAKLALTNLTLAEKAFRERVRPEPAIRVKLEEPFQLIDYLNDRQQRLEKLEQLAKERRVAVPPEVWSSVPEYAVDEKQSSALWIQLFIAEQLLATAIRSEVSAINSLHILPVRTHEPAARSSPVLEEVSIKISLAGPMTAVSRFLLSLPLQKEELAELKLPAATDAKPSLFIDKILIRRRAPEKADQVDLELTASGFVPRA